ncbi:MAG: rod shape-determining protein MreC [Lentisphaeria bacterium]|nr:rod shape-determining protein MreC [Candidatus Neomarinimicrobiota bacterium]MCF7842104.1 rod shape-determining protein MreC [Lentisphaeria bacterium]
MQRIFDFFYRFRAIANLLLVLSFSLLVIFYQDAPQVRYMRGKIMDYATVLYRPIEWLDTVFTLEHAYQALEKKYIVSQIELNRLQALAAENERLRQALGFKQTSLFEVIPANVLSKSGTSLLTSISVDQGAKDGVELLAPVVDANANLVGKVVALGDASSLVQLIHDRNFRVSVREMRTRTIGILGFYDPGVFRIENIPLNTNVAIGDSVVTSGFSDIFPPNIYVGVVQKVEPGVEGYVKAIQVEVATDYHRLEEVFILKKNES